MADKFSARITGIKATNGKMAFLRKAVIVENVAEMQVIVKRIEAEAKRIVPKSKVAQLIKTVNSEVESTNRKVTGLIGANKTYAPKLEDPKSNLKHASRKGFIGKPTPFLVPALQRNFSKISSGVAKAVKRAVRRAT